MLQALDAYYHPEKLGKKIYITGKGRCNVTNDCTQEEFLRQVPRNPRFLYSALSHFDPQDMMALLEVRVTMDGDKIANVEVMSHGETAGIGTKAIDAMPAAFVGKTAAEVEAVDTVSGATVTSGALRAAVLDALSKVK